jgi:hypothetical protein
MSQIFAAENQIIDYDAQRWRLLINSNGAGPRVVVEAAPGMPLRYVPSFANTRRLPQGGALPVDYVVQVVLGWSNHDEAWHLGLVLNRDLADTRGSRWCEIAHWPDPDTTTFIDLARQAGETLAHTLDRPFVVIPPRIDRAAPPPPPPLPDLPLSCGLWTLERVQPADVIQFTRSRRWATSRLTRMVWYAFWVVVYVLLAVTTLNTDLALPNAGTMLPNPELLPYLGLLAAGVLVLMTLYMLGELFTRPNRIVLDFDGRSIAALRGDRERWRYTDRDVQSVYVTHVVQRKGRRRIVQQSELNLHFGGGRFRQVLQQAEQDDLLEAAENGVLVEDEAVVPLARGASVTDYQSAALYVAEALGGVPCWYDQRLR